MLFSIYNLFLNTVGIGVLLALRPKIMYDETFYNGRLGSFAPELVGGGSPRIWLHAASVGEVVGILPTISLLRDQLPQAALYLTVGTLYGFHFARKQVAGKACVLPFPLDFPWVLKKAFDSMKPDVYVAVESEFWPNLYHILRQRRITALLLNGHLSDRSTRRYSLWKPLFSPIFKQFRWLAMHSPEDRQNALALGADPKRVLVMGTAKYDGLSSRVNKQKAQEWRNVLDIPPSLPVVVGGSLRGSECVELLRVFHRLQVVEPKTVGIFVPRHLERLPSMIEWLKGQNIPFQLLSQITGSNGKRYAPIVLVDRIGILFELYALGNLVFCGGTLEPIGGHNILEPAAWGKAVFYGPHVEKVYQERRFLESSGGSFLAEDAEDLLRQWTYWIQHLAELGERGESAREAIRRLEGVAARQVGLIIDALAESEQGKL
jgi:3-deoxy-D-manno-octulosonic-acid transferase